MGSSLPQRRVTVRRAVKAVPYPWVVVGLVLAGQMGAAWPSQGLPVLYPFIQKEFSLSRAEVGLITSALMGGSITTAFLGGWLADVLGVKRVMVILLVTLALLMGAFFLVYSLPGILVLVALTGTVQAPGYPAGTRAIMEWIPHRTRALAMSVKQTGVPLGAAIAAGVLPAVSVAVGWRLGAVVLGALTLVIGIVFLALYRDAPRDAAAVPRMSLATLRVLTQNRSLVMAAIWASTFVALQFIVLSYIILFLIEALEVPAVVAGGYLAVAHVSSVFARVLWGAVSDFLFGTRRVVVLGILGLLATAGLMGTSLVGGDVPRAVVFLLVVALGVTTLSWHGVFTAHIGELVGTRRVGTALGAVHTLMRGSTIAVPPLFGLLVDVSGSYSVGWGAAAAIAFVSTLALVAFGKEVQRAGTLGQRSGRSKGEEVVYGATDEGDSTPLA